MSILSVYQQGRLWPGGASWQASMPLCWHLQAKYLTKNLQFNIKYISISFSNYFTLYHAGYYLKDKWENRIHNHRRPFYTLLYLGDQAVSAKQWPLSR